MANSLTDIGVGVVSAPAKEPPVNLAGMLLPDQMSMQMFLLASLMAWSAYMLFALVKTYSSR